MRTRDATTSSDAISFWATLTVAIAGGGLMVFVALPLASSNPFPTVKERAFVLEASPVRASLIATAGHESFEASAAHAGIVVDKQGTVVPIGSAAVVPVAGPIRVASADASTDMLTWEPSFKFDAAPLATISDDAVTITPAGPRARPTGLREVIDEYLWEVYLRQPIKKDGSGDFTWKDPAAAKKVGMSLKDYVIGGMDEDFREVLYHAGQAMDAEGLDWSILSGFRDDYRQSLASGFKASTGYSLHGGSRRTGGYGHGRAADITSAEGGEASAVWSWIDRNGARYGIDRPMKARDPAHIQANPRWKLIAGQLRTKRSLFAKADR